MKTEIKNENGDWVEGAPIVGKPFRNVIETTKGLGYVVHHEFIDPTITKSQEERAWRDSELQRTDSLMLIPDYPNKEKLTCYREELRTYPESEGFPFSKRPELIE